MHCHIFAPIENFASAIHIGLQMVFKLQHLFMWTCTSRARVFYSLFFCFYQLDLTYEHVRVIEKVYGICSAGYDSLSDLKSHLSAINRQCFANPLCTIIYSV